ncbi:hypothetical protein N665_0332s0034 [Sinapis alba]|nr:hypothetical protein N665_0332s0034 [Sinapis alba]
MNNFMKLFAIFLFIQIQIALSQPNLILPPFQIKCRCRKTNETLTYLISVIPGGGSRADFEKYGTCIDQDYGASVDRYLPAALANLKAKKYSGAIANLQDVVTASGDCENQFAGSCPLPLSQRNKAVHDIADMTTDIIKTFV